MKIYKICTTNQLPRNAWSSYVKYIWRHSSSMNEYIVDCHCSILLKLFRGWIPLFFSFRVSIPSRNFLCVHFASLATILAFSQSTPSLQIDACFARPPSPSFIRFLAFSASPFSMSCSVSRTLFLCSFSRDSHFLSVSPVYEWSLHLHGIRYTTFVFFPPRGVFAFEIRSSLCWKKS